MSHSTVGPPPGIPCAPHTSGSDTIGNASSTQMSSRTCILIAALGIGFGSLPLPGQSMDRHNELTTEEVRAGWVLLFDGQTSKGWRSPGAEQFPAGYWRIEDGFLRGEAIASRAVDLQTADRFRNFELQLEWKIAHGGNSGLKYLVGSSQKLVFDGDGPPQPEGTSRLPQRFYRE